MTTDLFHGPEAEPATFFAEMWLIAESTSATDRANAELPRRDFRDNIEQALALDDGRDCAEKLRQLVDPRQLGQVMDVLRAMDLAFATIHPRNSLPASPVPRQTLPHWLRELRDQRPITGHYWQRSNRRLLPRGPLLRVPRHEWASNTDCLADHFSYLTLVPVKTDENMRPIGIKCIVVGCDAVTGIPHGPKPGAETIAVIPLAEVSDDLDITPRTGAGKTFLRIQGRAGLMSGRLTKALALAGKAEIALVPELVTTEEELDVLAEELRRNPRTSQLILAGSGNTLSVDAHGLPWNEARVLHGAGSTLWRQRKIQIAGMTGLANQLGLLADATDIAFEDNSSADEVVVADLDGLGRCVVLICQDVMVERMATDIIRHYQPDWVFVPILDKGVDVGRWTHQKAFHLSGEAHTRFVIVSSTSLSHRLEPTTEVPCGLAIGPKTSTHADPGRLCLSVTASGSPKLAILQWRKGSWVQTTLAATSPMTL